MKTIYSLACVLMLVACAAQRSSAAVATLTPVADTTIFSNAVGNSAGGGNGLFAGDSNNSPPARRALIQFDLSSIPVGATIQNAQLTLVMGMAAGGGTTDQTIELHRLTNSWGEGTVLGVNPPTDTLGGQGQGGGANAGDATWSSRFFSTTLWNTAGGDFIAAPSAALANVNGTTNSSYTWSSATLLTDVQGWFSGSLGNFGWLIKNADEVTTQNFRAFYSRNVATVANRPVLTVTYAIPEPSAFSLLACVAELGVSKRTLRLRSR